MGSERCACAGDGYVEGQHVGPGALDMCWRCSECGGVWNVEAVLGRRAGTARA